MSVLFKSGNDCFLTGDEHGYFVEFGVPFGRGSIFDSNSLTEIGIFLGVQGMTAEIGFAHTVVGARYRRDCGRLGEICFDPTNERQRSGVVKKPATCKALDSFWGCQCSLT